jgi:putative ABC transport system permease protein
MWNPGPVFRGLLRNRFGTILVVIQLALATAILSNLYFVIQLIDTVHNAPMGIDPESQFSLNIRPTQKTADYPQAQADLERLRQIPGVAAVAAVRWMPLAGQGKRDNLQRDANPDSPSLPVVTADISPEGLTTMGLPLASGRDFTADDMVRKQGLEGPSPKVVIISQALAEELAGKDGNALGRILYKGKESFEVVGVTRHWRGFTLPGIGENEKTVFFPVYDDNDTEHRYQIRTQSPGQIPAVREAVFAQMEQQYQNQVFLHVTSSLELLEFFHRLNSRLQAMLQVMMLVLAGILILAIGGQTLYWVNQRRKAIGIRRALGATQGDILRWFLLENLMICGFAVVLGTLLTQLINNAMIGMIRGNGNWIIEPLSPLTLLTIDGLLLVLCLACAYWPARQAARLAPRLATSGG